MLGDQQENKDVVKNQHEVHYNNDNIQVKLTTCVTNFHQFLF